MRSIAPVEHNWVQQRFLGLALGTLEVASRARCEAHMADCTECTERFAAFGAESGAETAAQGHLSAAMIARWDRARHALTGIERESVRLHLQRCDLCREELKLVGQTASLPLGAAPRRRMADWAPWLGGGVVGALATAASLLWLVGPSRTVPPEQAPPNGAPQVTAPASAELLALPWIAPASLRGDAMSLELPAATRELALTLAVAAVADGSAALLRVHGPDGAIVAAAALGSDAVHAGTAIVVFRNQSGWQAGSYRVVLREAGVAQAPDSTESYFELEIRP